MNLGNAAFNHILNQHPVLRARLARHAGRRLALKLPPLEAAGVVTDEGWLAACEGEPEARVVVRHAAALAALSGRPPAMSDVVLEGDAELAADFGRLVSELSWDAGEDLSRLLGDAAAHRVETLARGLLGFKGQVALRLLDNWVEHLRDEAPLLARRGDVARFVADVDALRDDAERAEKRLSRLEAACSQKVTR